MVPRPNVRWSFVAGALGALAGLMVLNGCQTSSPPRSAEPAPLDTRTTSAGAGATNLSATATTVLQEGDVVAITFQYSTNFNTLQKITMDGMLNLEAVGTVKAAGRTLTELQTELARLYKPQVKDDLVTAKLMAAATGVYVSGAVIRPGRIPMERPMTALEAIMEAGGFDPNRARISAVTVLRVEEGKQRTYHLNLKQVLNGREPTPFYLKPFDIVHVPTKTFNF